MKTAFSWQQLDEILSKTDIVEIVSQYVPLKKSGNNFKARCPFHDEKTPSFVVNSEKQIFHCFGCGVGGNVFNFLMKIDSVSFPEAVAVIAEKAGIKITFENPAVTQEKKALLDANKTAQEFYHNFLFTQEGKAGIEYFHERNLTDRNIKDMGLGYAPASGYALRNEINKKALKQDAFEKAGLIHKETGKDYFRNRVLFPIFDIRGNVIAFGGRALDSRQVPKYLNTAETPVFNKSWSLYGLNVAKTEIHNQEFAIIVEGYFDVARLFINGIKNVVAPLGTSLSNGHLTILKRFTDKLLLVFDSDEAGIKAAMRNLDNILKHGFEVKIAELPGGFDPDKFIEEYNISSFKEFINQAHDFIDFAIHVEKQLYDVNSAKNKSSVAKHILSLIAIVPDEIERAEYVKQTAEKLEIQEDVLNRYLSEMRNQKETKSFAREKPQDQKVTGQEITEELLIEILMSDSRYWEKIWEWKGCLTERIEKLIQAGSQLKEQNLAIQTATLMGNIEDDKILQWLSNTAIDENDWDEEKKDRVFSDCLAKLNKISSFRKLDAIKMKLKEKRENGFSYQEELQEIQSLLISAKKE